MIMKKPIQDLIKIAYAAFNERDIDTVLSTMHRVFNGPRHLKADMLPVMMPSGNIGQDNGRK